jgi:hypothetical protein
MPKRMQRVEATELMQALAAEAEAAAWIAATWASASGVKLTKILAGIPDDHIWLDDTTLEIADKASGVKPPDLDHVRGVLQDRNIKAVLACGKQAGAAIDKLWDGPLVKIPHPAVRVLSNQVLGHYNTEIHTMFKHANNYRVYRVTLDTYGYQTAATINSELNFGCSWIRPRLDEQAAGVAGGSEAPDPSVLPVKRAGRSRRSALVRGPGHVGQDPASGT